MIKQTMILGILLALTTPLSFGKVKLPSEIYQSTRGELIKLKGKDNGEYRAKFIVRGTNVYRLAQDVEAKARQNGYHLISKDIHNNTADLSFQSMRYRLNASINLNLNNTMSYEIERELN